MTVLRDILVNSVEQAGALGQFDCPKCINYKPGGDKRGYFSIVFHARCKSTGKDVAIKFFDPAKFSETYRLQLFDREPELLKKVIGAKRCSQLLEPMAVHNIILNAAGTQVPVPMKYFVTEWVPYDIDSFFFEQDRWTPLEKLQNFKNMVLAVEALHRKEIYHRDLKYDNMRSFTQDTEGPVVVIDFGTAARLDSAHLKSEYDYQVGAYLYSGPEAFVGFAGERNIARYTDFYALGALLYELFNIQNYYCELTNRHEYNIGFSIVSSIVAPEKNMAQKLKLWGEAVTPLRDMLQPPPLLCLDHTVPLSIYNLLNQMYLELVEFDFRKRLSDFDKIRLLIDRAILALKNNLKETREIEKRKAMRKLRQDKAARQEEKLNLALNNRRGLA